MANRHERRMHRTDLFFGLLALLSVIFVAVHGFLPDSEGSADADPLLVGGILLGLTVLVAFIMQKVTQLDRRCSEDYRFVLMAQSATVAVGTTFLVNAAFEDFLLGYWLGNLTSENVVGIMLGAWAFSYFVYRIKGSWA